ncbi:MAG: urate hydroxylase PuuD [Verrucomicrobia bacterium]|nr:MAG: urate hydroxylase PuuD [Verrucomicrobiota bacterium]
MWRKARAKNRSKNNTVILIPVVFIMISNHYPSTYGSSRSSLILSALVLAVWAAAKNIRKA